MSSSSEGQQPSIEIGGKAEEKKENKREERIGRRSSKTGAKADIAMTISVAEEANTPSAGDNRACSNGRYEKDKCSSGERTETRDGGS